MIQIKYLKKILIIICFALSATAWANPPAKPNPDDPYETYNRHAYCLNKKLDEVVFRPVASLYKAVTPSPLVTGINNFFSNLSQIPTFLNDVLQGDIPRAGKDICRFAINSTLGMGGFLDIASQTGFEANPQDVGLTFARWGYQSSHYLVLPIIGPSTVRDAIGWPLYYYLTVYPYIPNETLSNSLLAMDFINIRTQLLDLDPVIEQSFDPYVFERNAYMQRRNYLIRKNAGLNNAAAAPDAIDSQENSKKPKEEKKKKEKTNEKRNA
jgi:phospholipid-binding lipoprotein MlaA